MPLSQLFPPPSHAPHPPTHTLHAHHNSGGDWSFHDGGALRLSGTEGASVLSCVFLAPGGNALMLSGHSRRTTIAGNHFAWTGASAIVSAGLGGDSATGGADYPEGTLIAGNLMREIGVYVKQSGGLYQGVSANLTLRGNVMFNAARAAVNLNDGFAGGHLLTQNLLFNAVRETNDHGPVNVSARVRVRGDEGEPPQSLRCCAVLQRLISCRPCQPTLPPRADMGPVALRLARVGRRQRQPAADR